MQYLFQILLYTALMYGIYLLLLKNRSEHFWSRVYLLVCATLPLILPLVKINLTANTHVVATIQKILLPVITIGTGSSTHHVISSQAIFILIYALITAFLLFRFMMGYTHVMHFVRSKDGERTNDGITILLNTNEGPGSWRNYIFIPGKTIDPVIIEHERAHIHLKHTYDILLIKALQCILWPNLFLFLIERELKMVHEFQADAYAAVDKTTYGHTLLNQLFETNYFSLSHTFFHNPLKRRIMILKKKKTTHPYLLKVKLVTTTVILLSGIIYLQSCKPNTTATVAPNKSMTTITTGTQIDSAYAYADKMPEPKFDYASFIKQNLVYPADAKVKKIEGRVVVKFIVDKNGDVINPIVLRSPDPSLSAAAMDVVKKMPKWTPGENKGQKVNVFFILPLQFQLSNNN